MRRQRTKVASGIRKQVRRAAQLVRRNRQPGVSQAQRVQHGLAQVMGKGHPGHGFDHLAKDETVVHQVIFAGARRVSCSRLGHVMGDQVPVGPHQLWKYR